jgi:hypothetical protein
MTLERQGEGQRGQLVLVAAIALALALVALGVAYLQLSYDTDTRQPTQTPAAQLEGALERAVHNSTADIPARYAWGDRSDAAVAVQDRLDTKTETLATSRLADGHAYDIERNATRATQWARTNCTTGPNRQFGGCATVDGIVLQDRDGQTHVLAVVFDIEITTPDGTTAVTLSIVRQAS